MSEVQCRYIFNFNSPDEQRYNLLFDYKTMSLLEKSFDGEDRPSLKWAELENNKCSNCPLSKSDHKYCPAARSFSLIAKKFADIKSYKETKVAVVTADRTYLKQTSTQEALHSIFGLIMATSDCPHMKFLRPMARFHLPFSNSTETMVRSISFYLLKQYFKKMNESDKSIDLEGFKAAYNEIQIVNQHLVERIRSLGKGDADLNAIIILDGFASLLSMAISDDFADLKPLFE